MSSNVGIHDHDEELMKTLVLSYLVQDELEEFLDLDLDKQEERRVQLFDIAMVRFMAWHEANLKAFSEASND